MGKGKRWVNNPLGQLVLSLSGGEGKAHGSTVLGPCGPRRASLLLQWGSDPWGGSGLHQGHVSKPQGTIRVQEKYGEDLCCPKREAFG